MKLFDKIILFCSIYVLIEIAVSSILFPDNMLPKPLLFIDTIICILFIYDFFNGLLKAKKKRLYIEVHWLDLLGSIPLIGHNIRIFRVFRVLRALRSLVRISEFLYKRNSLKLMNFALFMATLIVATTTFCLYFLEKDHNGCLDELSECFWWTVYTLSGVGYEDILPQTEDGKFFGLILTITGICLVAILTASLVDIVIKDKEIKEQLDKKQQQIDRMEGKINELIQIHKNKKPNIEK